MSSSPIKIKMKNKSLKSLLAALTLLLSLMFAHEAIAQTDKSSAQNSAQYDIDDSDLSIEELKKKYPPSLLDKKNKAYKPGQKVDIKDYSIAEVKAAFLNADKNFISRIPMNEIPRTASGKYDSYISDNDVIAHSQLELDIIDASCNKFGLRVYTAPKKYEILQSFIFSSDKIRIHSMRFLPQKTEVCLFTNDPLGVEDHNDYT
ncbi:MAG: hypothetical protein V4694_03875 [Pseudomonadota bacterium]